MRIMIEVDNGEELNALLERLKRFLFCFMLLGVLTA